MKILNDTAIFLAARSGSKRLPNKHFLKLNSNYTVIDFCIKRLMKSKITKNIFLCTTKRKEDNKFEDVCKKHKIKLFRGHEKNVLKRFIDCARQNSIKNIVRITADCPLIDVDILDKCIEIHHKKKLDYTSNVLELSYPDGLDVEVITLKALIRSNDLRKKDLQNQEHVTSFIRKSGLFKKYNLASSGNYSDRRWTLDNRNDLDYLKKIVDFFSPNIYFSWKKIIRAEKKLKIPSNIKRRINQRNFFKKKIIIGSANFSQRYGVDNNKVNLNEITKILYLAKKNKINRLDTAASYLSDVSFFNNYKNKLRLISKINPDTKWTSYNFCKNQLKWQIKKLNNNIEILLFHDTKILYKKEGKKIFNNIKILKKKGYLKKIGISVYDPKCLSYLTSKYDIEVVQCPYNIFDKRIVNSGWLKKLKKKQIEVHARSIFLQGVLLNKRLSNKRYFKKWKENFSKWFKYLKKNKISEIDYCINDIINQDFDRIIVGIDSFKNFNQLLKFKLLKNINGFIDLTTNDLKLIDPRKWKII